MKKLLTFVLLFTISLTFAQQNGKVLEGKTIKSTILGKDVRYTIYLPPDYATSDRTYPVVYLLHGYTDDDTGWLQFGEIDRYADKAINDGTIPPMIIVMPDGGVSWYINSYDGQTKYEDFFIKEFMPNIEKNYHIKAQKKYRGIAGLSMGGYGAMIYALKYPDLFAAAAPLSAAFRSDDDLSNAGKENYDKIFSLLYGRNLEGKSRLTKTWYDNSIFKLTETKTVEELKKVRYYIDCGDKDFLIKANCQYHMMLLDKGVPHEFRVREGFHNWTYWRTGITDALEFIGDSFHQK